MTKDEILAECDAKAAEWLPLLESYVEGHLATHGRYWQGLKSHTVTPADGEEERPDVGAKHPHDQAAEWPPALRNALLPFAATVDVYGEGTGVGYTVTLAVVIEGEEWTRVENEGPLGWLARPWAALDHGVLA